MQQQEFLYIFIFFSQKKNASDLSLRHRNKCKERAVIQIPDL